VPELEFDCGLATVALLEADVTEDSLVPEGGSIAVRRVDPSAALLAKHEASADRIDWWMQRLERTFELRRRVEEQRDA
jgi:O-succinylbenzoate synthase